MGQYYKPIFLKEDTNKVEKWFYSHDYDCGLKLMEHSWMKNPFVLAVETQLMKTPKRIVWGGDYADEEKRCKTNLYGRCTEKTKSHRINHHHDAMNWHRTYSFLVNHTKKEYVNKMELPANNDGWRIHPLPLLTCEGNGRGGGDYRGESELVGSWSRDLISIEPNLNEFKDYKKISFELVEA
jgi:hypothetical protein